MHPERASFLAKKLTVLWVRYISAVRKLTETVNAHEQTAADQHLAKIQLHITLRRVSRPAPVLLLGSGILRMCNEHGVN